jgi:hypothetical protein
MKKTLTLNAQAKETILVSGIMSLIVMVVVLFL